MLHNKISVELPHFHEGAGEPYTETFSLKKQRQKLVRKNWSWLASMLTEKHKSCFLMVAVDKIQVASIFKISPMANK